MDYSSGVAYKLGDDGKIKEIWRTKGWYSFEGFISDDGRYLACFGPWGRDQKNHTDVGITFYKEGRLLKQYQVRELIRRPELIEDSVSHYSWRPVIQTKPNGFDGEVFHLVTIDQTVYTFDVHSGAIIGQTQDEKAKSQLRLHAEENEEARKRGDLLFQESSFKEDFERHFEISGIRTMNGAINDCSVTGALWSAHLKPKQVMAHDADVQMVLPIIDGKRIAVTLKAEQIVDALKAAFAHPFVVSEILTYGEGSLYLEILGDRLHWNVPQMVDYVTRTTGIEPKGDLLAHWAGLHLHTPATRPGKAVSGDQEDNIRSVCFYLNTRSGEVILEDTTKWPYEPQLIPAGGKADANGK
ncbi:hypothetical protein [Brevifollis gellanilyticus]|uniref:Uncharacterized protein n=1 Tax=Brevifollis gellanilyticus TaxID=748831 RepID=A0A512M960_9BACT|nr:hypothetical protein [Brevifollis gellanilyticus]GEP43262.1 hypothetical protein BGE01nite_25530 [Brevifollis gellanilyticus]